jgi:hypothetical protein
VLKCSGNIELNGKILDAFFTSSLIEKEKKLKIAGAKGQTLG